MLRTKPRGVTSVSRRAFMGVALGAAFLLPALSGCSTDSSTTLRIAYKQWGSGEVMETFLAKVSEQFRQEHPDIAIKLMPRVAGDNDYFTKNELMMSSETTAPDLVYEDTFIVKSDVAAGYLRPINAKLPGWPVWSEFYDSAKSAVTEADGKVYGVPIGTDTRALWYNSELFAQAGLPVPWQPNDWTELLRDLATLQKALPGVTPFNIFSGKALGEASSMQGFEMLLYGTEDTLYDAKEAKWVIGSRGFVDSLEFIRGVFHDGMAPPLSKALNPNLSDTIYNDWLPQRKLAVNLDGGWLGLYWTK
ncbi:trehalose/maltose-binding protein [Renibacterium salmoninarum ATCC 33209]|uniref:Trehalose/maltose-binding protein n=1 Tax=Renibacterium salmoninarum (strain ATCC 33209 / DSM 20767 / JCM 11484 / NBRC 15589 / NCIMB 2235) TaxID=288705 RepID=A9WLZ4_RENSM|nr:extracellular solute-binding protein [Renibacterium salmoninarum]ABY22175.1 trehalose/maltose-binding protein [Renibacterium salmoninarum ATCC 33209]